MTYASDYYRSLPYHGLVRELQWHLPRRNKADSCRLNARELIKEMRLRLRIEPWRCKRS